MVAMFCVEDEDSHAEGDEPEAASYANEEDYQCFHIASLHILALEHSPECCRAPWRQCERGGCLHGTLAMRRCDHSRASWLRVWWPLPPAPAASRVPARVHRRGPRARPRACTTHHQHPLQPSFQRYRQRMPLKEMPYSFRHWCQIPRI
jgi:hypothetical protein